MRVHALFDETGAVHALLHPATGVDAPQVAFFPAAGQRTAELDVPTEMEQWTHHAIHAGVAVDLVNGEPRLVRKPGPR